jgi:3-hydroxymyristoyl/3-hydroxydecanoyl-(acyl carrier protein) dehydratase
MAPAENRYASATDILAALPHRPPFLFIDRVEALEVGRAIHAVKNVAPVDVCGDGAVPRLPPLFLLECFGQAGVLLVAAEREDDARLGVLLGTVESFESSGEVVAGDAVDIEVRFEKRTSKMAILGARALVRGAPVAEANFTAYFYWESSEK